MKRRDDRFPAVRGRFVDASATVYETIGRCTLLLLGAALLAGTLRTGIGVAMQWPRFLDGGSSVLGAALALAWLALCVAVATVVARRASPLSETRFVAAVVLAGVLLHGTLIALVEPVWAGDYLRYWQHAQTMAAVDGVPTVTNIWSQRALLIAYPVAEWFGASAPTALKFVNAMLLLIVQLALYDVARLALSRRIAQSSAVLLLAAPMPAFSLLIPSHELWGLCFFVLTAWTFTRLHHAVAHAATRRVVGWTAALTAAVFCLDLQRSIGIVFVLMLLLVSAGQVARAATQPERGRRRAAWLQFALVCVVAVLQIPLGAAARHAGLLEVQSPGRAAQQAMKLAAHGATLGDARSPWVSRFLDRFGDRVRAGPEEAADFARAVALSNWIHAPLAKLQHATMHAPRLFEPGYPLDWDVTLAAPADMSAETRNSLILAAHLFGIAIGLLAAFGLLRGAVADTLPSSPVQAMVAAIAAIAAALLLLFENKPPNLFPAWSVWLLFAAMALAPHESTAPRTRTMINRVGVSATALLIALAAAWLVAAALFPVARGRILDGWTLHVTSKATTATAWERELAELSPEVFARRHIVRTRLADNLFRAAGDDQTRLTRFADSLYSVLALPVPMLPGDQATLQTDVCHADARRGLDFYAFAPYRRPDVADAFSLHVDVDGRRIASLPIPLESRDTLQHVRLADAFTGNGCHALALTLEANVARDRPSWQTASRVEVWFPRLVP